MGMDMGHETWDMHIYVRGRTLAHAHAIPIPSSLHLQLARVFPRASPAQLALERGHAELWRFWRMAACALDSLVREGGEPPDTNSYALAAPILASLLRDRLHRKDVRSSSLSLQYRSTACYH